VIERRALAGARLVCRAARAVALGALLLAVACAGDPLAPPETAAQELFRLARDPDRSDAALQRLIGPERDPERLAALGDALDALARIERVEIVGVEPLAGLERTAIDLRATLPGGGAATISVQVETRPGETPRLVWFQGPGVEWPPAARRAGPDTTTQPPMENR